MVGPQAGLLSDRMSGDSSSLSCRGIRGSPEPGAALKRQGVLPIQLRFGALDRIDIDDTRAVNADERLGSRLSSSRFMVVRMMWVLPRVHAHIVAGSIDPLDVGGLDELELVAVLIVNRSGRRPRRFRLDQISPPWAVCLAAGLPWPPAAPCCP